MTSDLHLLKIATLDNHHAQILRDLTQSPDEGLRTMAQLVMNTAGTNQPLVVKTGDAPLSIKEAADFLDLAENTIRRYTALGALPAEPDGDDYRIAAGDLITLQKARIKGRELAAEALSTPQRHYPPIRLTEDDIAHLKEIF